MNRIFISLALTVMFAQWIAVLVAYPFLPQRFPTFDWLGPAQAYAFDRPRFVFPGTFHKVWLFTWPPMTLVLQALFWFRGPRTSFLNFLALLATGWIGYLQCLCVWSGDHGPIDLSHSMVATVWWGLFNLFIPVSAAIIGLYFGVRALVRFFRQPPSVRMMLMFQPGWPFPDFLKQTARTSTKERTWIDNRPITARFSALTALIVFVLCMATGVPFVFAAAFMIAMGISIAPVVYSRIYEPPTPETAAPADAHVCGVPFGPTYVDRRTAAFLKRIAKFQTQTPRCVRKQSEWKLFGLPIYDIAIGPDPDKGEVRGHARGIIAIGDIATGGLAAGGFARGLVAVGGGSAGIIAIGGGAVGLAAIGGLAVGGFALGGLAIGGFAVGGAAIGGVAIGAAALGYYAAGTVALGRYTVSLLARSPEAVDFFRRWIPWTGQ